VDGRRFPRPRHRNCEELGNWFAKTVELLLDHKGVTSDVMDRNGRTPLSWAAESGDASVVELCLHREDVALDS
jgi:ankyrin repeat protein